MTPIDDIKSLPLRESLDLAGQRFDYMAFTSKST